MNKSCLIALFIVFLLISTGCQKIGLGKKVKPEEKDTFTESVHKGLKGLTINFVKNNPPQIIYSSTPLNMIIELKNEGAANIVGGKLYVSGFDPNIVKLNRDMQIFNIEGKTKYNPTGGIQNLDFSSTIYLPSGTEVYKPTILVSACYEYKTTASPLVCINPNPYTILENPVCQVKPISLAEGQGAPVSITKIEEEAIPGEAIFKIYIENQKNQGTVIDKSGYGMSKCPNDLEYSDIDTVYYSVSLSGTSISSNCKPSNKIKLVDGKGVLYCTAKLPSTTESAYQSILNIELYYGYLSQIKKQIEIRSIS